MGGSAGRYYSRSVGVDEAVMMLRLKRPLDCGAGATVGELFVDGQFMCYTLEDTDRKLEAGGTKIKCDTAIPRGTYDVIITHSNRFGKMMPLLLDVPQFDGVRIHSGNTAADTEGCILVGAFKRGNDFIGSSRAAYQSLFEKLDAAIEQGDKIRIEIA